MHYTENIWYEGDDLNDCVLMACRNTVVLILSVCPSHSNHCSAPCSHVHFTHKPLLISPAPPHPRELLSDRRSKSLRKCQFHAVWSTIKSALIPAAGVCLCCSAASFVPTTWACSRPIRRNWGWVTSGISASDWMALIAECVRWWLYLLMFQRSFAAEESL